MRKKKRFENKAGMEFALMFPIFVILFTCLQFAGGCMEYKKYGYEVAGDISPRDNRFDPALNHTLRYTCTLYADYAKKYNVTWKDLFWQRGKDVIFNGPRKSSEDPRFEVVKSEKDLSVDLIISDLEENDSDDYQCTVNITSMAKKRPDGILVCVVGVYVSGLPKKPKKLAM